MDQVAKFIWEFKIGDNIKYNHQILSCLIEKNESGLLNKPIAVTAISIIEAVLIDLVARLWDATDHFPEGINHETKKLIKEELDKKTSKKKRTDSEGNTLSYRKLRNLSYREVVAFYSEFKLLGSNETLYESLDKMGHFRNRVHIKNYHGNFQRDERLVFTNERTKVVIKIMESIVDYFETNYSRPWR